MIHIVLWKWTQVNFRHPYAAEHVNAMTRMLLGNLKGVEHRIICVTDDPAGVDPPVQTYPLWDNHGKMSNPSGKHLPSCYRRLRLFSPEAQRDLDISVGDKVVSLDLDSVIIGHLGDVLGRKERFVSWHVRGMYHPRVFNGSFWMFTAGDLTELWDLFDPNVSPAVTLKAGFMGSDQAWLSYKMSREPCAFGLQWPQFASYPREVRRMRLLDKRTKIVFFHGAHKPWHKEIQNESPWITRYWFVPETAKTGTGG